jgi:hypothetical protein
MHTLIILGDVVLSFPLEFVVAIVDESLGESCKCETCSKVPELEKKSLDSA